MRSAHNTDIITTDDEKMVIGVYLPGDYCAEHECGIGDIYAKVKPDRDALGIEARKINETRHFVFVKGKKAIFLGCGVHQNSVEHLVDVVSRTRVKTPVIGEWDQSGFAIAAKAKTPVANALIEIHKAVQEGDAYIMLGGKGDNPFARAGINLGIISRVPEKVKNDLLEHDTKARELQKAWEPVQKHLDTLLANPTLHWLHEKYASRYGNYGSLSYFYLGPRCLEQVEGSKYPFRLLLNPNEQDIYQAGWYTVEEIEAWSRGEGPVIEGSRFFRLHAAFDTWKRDGKVDVNTIPDYYGICPGCESLLKFGNGPEKEVESLKNYSTFKDPKRFGKCPKCGAHHSTFLYSDYHRK